MVAVGCILPKHKQVKIGFVPDRLLHRLLAVADLRDFATRFPQPMQQNTKGNTRNALQRTCSAEQHYAKFPLLLLCDAFNALQP